MAAQAEKTPSPIAVPYNPYLLIFFPEYLRNSFELRPTLLLSISFRPPLKIEFVPAVLVSDDRRIEDLAAEEIGEVNGCVSFGGVGVAEETRVGEGPAEEVWRSQQTETTQWTRMGSRVQAKRSRVLEYLRPRVWQLCCGFLRCRFQCPRSFPLCPLASRPIGNLICSIR